MNAQPTIKPVAMRDALLERVWQGMMNDDKIFFLSADFGSPVLDRIRSDYPQRFVNVGIAEQNLINIAAGLALEGFKVFAYAIAPFITMRCYEQIRVSLALLSRVRPMNVNLIGVGAGYSYVVSGPTHQCYEDITLMRALPSFDVLSPADHVTAAALFQRCLETGPKYLRLDAQPLSPVYQNHEPNLAKGFHSFRTGDAVCLVATGYMLHTALKVAERLEHEGRRVAVVDLFDLTKFDIDALDTLLAGYKGIITLEEGFQGRGGLDALIFDLASRRSWQGRVQAIGVEPAYRFELGTRSELHEQVGIGEEIVHQRVLSFLDAIQP